MLRRVSVLFLCAGALPGQTPPAVPPVELADLTSYLGLSDQQPSRLQQVYQARQQALHQLWDQISTKQRELDSLLNSGAPDALAAGNLLIEIQTARHQIRDKLTHDAARAVLTDAQKQKLAALETAMRLRPALDQAVMTGLIEQYSRPSIEH